MLDLWLRFLKWTSVWLKCLNHSLSAVWIVLWVLLMSQHCCMLWLENFRADCEHWSLLAAALDSVWASLSWHLLELFFIELCLLIICILFQFSCHNNLLAVFDMLNIYVSHLLILICLESLCKNDLSDLCMSQHSFDLWDLCELLWLLACLFALLSLISESESLHDWTLYQCRVSVSRWCLLSD